MRRMAATWTLALATCAGCGSGEPAPSNKEPHPEPPATAAQTPSAASSPATPVAREPGQPASGSAQPQRATGPEAGAETEQRTTHDGSGRKADKATVGVGKKGQRYGGGIITEPIRARFRAHERIVFDSVTHALNLFQAEHGRLPETHDEFMEKIIRFNQIALPPLPAGDEYWYDPDKGQLMVRHPG